MTTAQRTAADQRGDMRDVAARIERLPYCSWHWKMRAIIGTAWFFDAFDSVAIAYVLPPLIGQWHLSPQQIGSMIGVASAWQRTASMVGTTIVGWILPAYGINAVFVLFGCFTLMGALVAFFFAVETRAQVLERLSPA